MRIHTQDSELCPAILRYDLKQYMTDIKLQRVYTNPSGSYGDGWRIYVDRLWPRVKAKQSSTTITGLRT